VAGVRQQRQAAGHHPAHDLGDGVRQREREDDPEAPSLAFPIRSPAGDAIRPVVKVVVQLGGS
jgi:hypothetical protein